MSSPLRFQSWYGQYSPDLVNLTATVCLDSLQHYAKLVENQSSSHTIVNSCYNVIDCLMEHTSESTKAHFASAAVLLGLTPFILMQIGPSVAEISMLSVHRPLLSFLLSLGSPSVWLTRLLEFSDPRKGLDEDKDRLVIDPIQRPWSIGVSVLEYASVVGAICNLVNAAVKLDQKTVIAWSCTFSYGSLAWTITPAAIHIVGAVGYRTLIEPSYYASTRDISQDGQGQPQDKQGARSVKRKIPNKDHPNFLQRLQQWVWQAGMSEGVLCANREKNYTYKIQRNKRGRVVVLLNIAAGILAFIHVVYGTLLLSSLLFIAVADVMTAVVIRVYASTIICRLVLVVEIGGLRERKEE